MLVVWGRRNSINVQKVMWTIGELGLAHVRRDVGGSFGGVDTPEFTRLNPNQRVPVIEDDGFVLWESNAIVRYLAARHGQDSLWPQDAQTRARADQWMDWMQNTLYTELGIVFAAFVRTPPEERDQAQIAAAAQRVGALLQHVNDQLADQPYMAGDTFTMGDIPLGAAVYRYYALDIEHAPLPHLQAWYQRLQERPAYQQHIMIPFGTTPAEWRALEQAGTWEATGQSA